MGSGQVFNEVERKSFNLVNTEGEMLSDGANDVLRSQILKSQDTQR